MAKNRQPFPGFIGPTYESKSHLANAEKCVNFYPEIIEAPHGRNQMALYPTPGYDNFATTNLSRGRGIFYQDGRGFAVIEGMFYEFSSSGTLTERGPVDVDVWPATICSSGVVGQELLITSGGTAYLFDLVTNTLSTISGISAICGGYLDGFFLILTADSELRISAYADGTTWDPTQFRVRAIASDAWVSMKVVNREIWLFGTKTYEVWYNAGTSPFPFGPIQGASYPSGIGARASAVEAGGDLLWLHRSDQGAGSIVQATQYSPRRVSNHAVEHAIQGYIRAGLPITNCIAVSYEEDGHVFVAFTFPSADATWVLDKSTGMWHERGYWDTTGVGQLRAWRPAFHALAFDDKHLMCDFRGGNILRVSNEIYTDAGNYIRRVRRTPHVANNGMRVRYHELEIDMQVGIGLVSGQGSDPLCMLRMSNNGGVTWGNEHTRSAGAIGEYNTTVIFNRLGQSNRRVFELAVSDPVPWRIIGAYLRASV